MQCKRLSGSALQLVILVNLLVCGTLIAQQPSEDKGWVRGSGGYSKGYLDEPGGLTVAGSVGVRLIGKWSIEPEVSWVSGERFEFTQVAANLIYRLGDPGKRVSWYPIVGIGYLREFDKAIDYSSGGMALYGGFGARMKVSGRLFVAPEFRFGVHTNPRLTVSVGYDF